VVTAQDGNQNKEKGFVQHNAYSVGLSE
jgi:hypothetical protein